MLWRGREGCLKLTLLAKHIQHNISYNNMINLIFKNLLTQGKALTTIIAKRDVQILKLVDLFWPVLRM